MALIVGGLKSWAGLWPRFGCGRSWPRANLVEACFQGPWQQWAAENSLPLKSYTHVLGCFAWAILVTQSAVPDYRASKGIESTPGRKSKSLLPSWVGL